MKHLSNAAAVGSLQFAAAMAVQTFSFFNPAANWIACSTTPAVRFSPASGTLLNKTTSEIKSLMKYFGTFAFTHHPSTCRARGKRKNKRNSKEKTTE